MLRGGRWRAAWRAWRASVSCLSGNNYGSTITKPLKRRHAYDHYGAKTARHHDA